jgi:hypothetical protein
MHVSLVQALFIIEACTLPKESIMKRTMKLAVLSSLVFAVQGAVAATLDQPYPSDAEASYSLPAPDTYADRMARAGRADEESQAWGVGKRQVTPHEPFPFGGGFIDD